MKTKINKIETKESIYRINDRMDNYGEGKTFITDIEDSFNTRTINGENHYGYALLSNDKMLAFIPYHAVLCIFFEEEND